MGLVRFNRGGGPSRTGYRISDRIVTPAPDAAVEERPIPLSRFPITDEVLEEWTVYDASAVDIEVPTDPSTIVRLDGCYEHDVTDEGFNPFVEDAGFNEMAHPSLWVAPDSTLTPHQGTVRVPTRISDVRPGVELVVVIDSHAHGLDPDDALEAVGGFTVCMDIAVHDDTPGLEGYRMFDTCLPCGPELVDPSVVTPEALALGIRVNGEPVDARSTTSLRFSLGELVSYVSEVLSLSPGDLITTGTPVRGVPGLEDGDEVHAWVESVGTLEATVEWEGS
jgi:5-oxopent-3-ene-1,2,5-tricarboxylate decarboxylase/2-hydroxyhepta-2,4-diene-1,7-dioate isomerase